MTPRRCCIDSPNLSLDVPFAKQRPPNPGWDPGDDCRVKGLTLERTTLYTMTMVREQSLGIVESELPDVTDDNLSSATARAFLNNAAHLEPAKRRLVATELAVRLWLKMLSVSCTYYPEFESTLRLYFSQETDPEEQLRTIVTSTRLALDVERLYHKFLCGMFSASRKTRYEFYQEMLIEVGLQMDLYDVEFGEKAMQFHEMAAKSIHEEHLLVFYSTGLLIKVYTAVNSKCKLPMAESELEKVYEYFERATPLDAVFVTYATDDGYFKSRIEEGFYPEVKKL